MRAPLGPPLGSRTARGRWCVSGAPAVCSPLWATKRASPWAAHVLHCTPVASCCLFWGVQLRGRTPGSLPVSVRVCARVQLSPACGAWALGADGPSVSPPAPVGGWCPRGFSVLALTPAEAGHLCGRFWPLVTLAGEVALSQACPSRVSCLTRVGVACVVAPRPSSGKWGRCSLPSSFAGFS